MKQVEFKIWMNRVKIRYIYLNGVAIRQYNKTELIKMQEDYITLYDIKTKFLEDEISYNEFIDIIKEDYNDFDAKFYNARQCKVDLNINEREEHINRLKNSGYESDWFIVVSCDLKNSSKLIDSKESNLNIVSDFLYELNDELVKIFSEAYYKQNMGDGFMALYKSTDLKKAVTSIVEIKELSMRLDKNLSDSLRNGVESICLGIAIDYSKVIIIYSQGDVLTGHAVNKASKLCKNHLRSIDEGVCLTTPRLRNIAPKLECTSIIKKKHQMDVLVLSQHDLHKLIGGRYGN